MLSDARTMIHAALTGVMVWLSFVLVLPGDTFAKGSSFQLMAKIATEDHWAMAFWIVASVGLSGLTTSSRVLRLLSVLVVSTMHGVFSLLLVLANPLNTGTGTYAIFAALGYYLAWRRAREGI